jgi:ABC-type transporter Mla maintaining outer membrane lipid asymmetry permease subunit MlaE
MRATDRMPTAGKLVSALGLAGLAWYGAGMIKAAWPVERDFGLFSEVAALVGLGAGWRVTGRRLGRGYMQGLSAGLTGLFALVVWTVFLLAFYTAMDRALQLRYDGPFEAAAGMFEIAVGYLGNAAQGAVVALLIAGAAATGLVAEIAERRLG